MIWKIDEFTKEITFAIISVSFISWFTCAVAGSFGVITNRIRTAIVGFSFTLVDVWNHIEPNDNKLSWLGGLLSAV